MVRERLRSGTLWIALACTALIGTGAGQDLPTYQTRYYVIHTDLNDDAVREASIRMTKMAEEYANRTRGFSGAIRSRLPFYLYGNPEDYYATGAPKQSAGVFNGQVLMAVAKEMDGRTWHIVQHEGFHQFAHAVIGGVIPPWANEGLAEYFGEAIFTGDGFVTGAIPQWRLERVRTRFAKKQFKSLPEMMGLDLGAWNGELALANYDQAWSMVQFLAHGDDGRYQKAFVAFMNQIAAGRGWQVAWKNSFGDAAGFEQRWREWWTKLPDNPTDDLYARATTATITSFMARAFSQGQHFENLETLAQAAAARQLKANPDDWLPPRLLSDALSDARELSKAGYAFAIVTPAPNKPPEVVCTTKEGKKLKGRFTVRAGKVLSVNVDDH
jgi:hypothetical protein